MEQNLEDMKPVVFPKELDRALYNTFKDVRCHSYPLDGLHWTKEQLATQGGGSPSQPLPLSLSSHFHRSITGVRKTLPRSQSEPNISISSRTYSSSKSYRHRSKENDDPTQVPGPGYQRKRTVSSGTVDARGVDSSPTSTIQWQPELYFLGDSYDEGDVRMPTASTCQDSDEIQTSFVQRTLSGTGTVRDIDIDEPMQIFPEPTTPTRCTTPFPPGLSSSTTEGDFGSDPIDLFAFGNTPAEFKARRRDLKWFDMGRSD